MSRDDSEAVDFLVEPAPPDGTRAGDEHLGHDPPASPARSRRARLGVVAAVAVLVVVLIAVAVHGNRAQHPTARPAPRTPIATPASTPTAPSFSWVPVPGNVAVDTVPALTPPPACPKAAAGRTACATSRQLPAAVDNAIRAHFPHVRRAAASSAVLRSGQAAGALWSRTYLARGGGLTLRVAVRRGADTEAITVAAIDNGARTTAYALQVIGAYTVQVEVVANSGVDKHEAALRLARDARLLALR